MMLGSAALGMTAQLGNLTRNASASATYSNETLVPTCSCKPHRPSEAGDAALPQILPLFTQC